jgi:hypothetical protein
MQSWLASKQQLDKGIVLYSTAHEAITPKMNQEELLLKEQELDPIAFKAPSNPDTLFLHEAMFAPYAARFGETMEKEVGSLESD